MVGVVLSHKTLVSVMCIETVLFGSQVNVIITVNNIKNIKFESYYLMYLEE